MNTEWVEQVTALIGDGKYQISDSTAKTAFNVLEQMEGLATILNTYAFVDGAVDLRFAVFRSPLDLIITCTPSRSLRVYMSLQVTINLNMLEIEGDMLVNTIRSTLVALGEKLDNRFGGSKCLPTE